MFYFRMKLSLIKQASKRVVVVGGGSAGISTAARLLKSRDIDVTIVDASKNTIISQFGRWLAVACTRLKHQLSQWPR